MPTLLITGNDLDRPALTRAARSAGRVVIVPAARERMRARRAIVDAALESGTPVYGLSTGVGVLKRVETGEDAAAYSGRVLRTHRAAQGEPLPADLVRATMIRLLNALAEGSPGVRPELADRLEAALADGQMPLVRALGSVGQADLLLMADLSAALFGDVLLAPGEGLALVTGNAVATAAAALAASDLERLLETMTDAGALSLEGLRANLSPLHPAVPAGRPYPGLRRAVEDLRAGLDGSDLWGPGAARDLQDPLTFRNLPHLLGAGWDALAHLDGILAVELNAAQGNPMVVEGEPRPVGVASFEILPLAAALDHVRIVLASVVGAATERAVKLLQTPWSGLATGLAPTGGTSDPGLTYLGIAAQGIAAEARLLAQPVSTELVSTSHAEGIEDRTTMAPLAARRLADQVELARRVVAIELVVAAQAVDLRGGLALGRGTAITHARVRSHIPELVAGCTVPDIEPLVIAIQEEHRADRP